MRKLQRHKLLISVCWQLQQQQTDVLEIRIGFKAGRLTISAHDHLRNISLDLMLVIPKIRTKQPVSQKVIRVTEKMEMGDCGTGYREEMVLSFSFLFFLHIPSCFYEGRL